MIDPKTLSDENLLLELDSLAKCERELLTEVLHLLREVERRRLFSDLGYTSLFTYAVGRLHYSEEQAQRRISAMRLMKELPGLEPELETGKFTLTSLGMAQTFIRSEEKATGKALEPGEKQKVLELVKEKPSREAQKILASIATNPASAKPDRAKVITSEFTELRVTVRNQVVEEFERMKSALAHQHPELTTGELLALLSSLGMAQWVAPAAPQVRSRRKLSPLQRQVWARDKGRCTGCNSRHALEVDHIIPKCKGGTEVLQNLRLLCRSCNQRAAIEELGQEKMDPFLGGRLRAAAASS